MTKTSNSSELAGFRLFWSRFNERGVILVLIVLCVILSIVTPNFRQLTNVINITRQIAEISIAAIGMTYIIIVAEIDLSIGSVYGLVAMIAGKLLANNFPVPLAIIVSIIAGAAIGLFNGVITTKLKVPAFIVTLSVLALARGAVNFLAEGYSLSVFPASANSFFVIGGNIGRIPIQIFIMFVLLIIAAIILSKTTFGFKIYATGGNKIASQLTGINTDRIKIYCFMICGATAAISGIISLAYLQSVHPSAGMGREMDVIAAVIVGGTYLYGGRGTILGTFIGAAIIGVVRNGMVLIGVPAYGQEAFIGFVILIAVIMDTLLRREKQ
jgi:ribose/xylose/arabinose/galactoside ABC-type transport system permease subunit